MISDKIERLLHDRKMTKSDLAEICGLSPSTISRIISGNREGKNATIRAIASALNVNFEWLVSDSAETKEEKTSSIDTLRDIINRDEACKRKLEEAEKIFKRIFSNTEEVDVLPYFTSRPIVHVEAVEENLNKFVFGSKVVTPDDFIPSPEEAVNLLTVAWLHDIGMKYPLFEDDKPREELSPEDIDKLRDTHGIRTSRYILEFWKESDNWLPEEKELLANICYFSQRKSNIEDFAPCEKKGIDGITIHLKVLVALLRLADACDARRFRPISTVRDVGWEEKKTECIYELEKNSIITNVLFDHAQQEIQLNANLPRVFDYKLGEFDLEKLVICIKDNIEEDLKSIQPVLKNYHNLGCIKVSYKINRISALSPTSAQSVKKYLSVWPYLLSLPSSSTELSGALVQILLFMLSQIQELGDDERKRILDITSRISKDNIFGKNVQNIHLEVEKILHQPGKGSKEVLTQYLEKYLEEAEKKLQKIVSKAKNLIDKQNPIIVYGYSKIVCRYLEEIQESHSAPVVYVVTCNTPVGNMSVNSVEDERLKTFVEKLKLDIKWVGLSGIYKMFDKLKTPTVLLGTHGVFENETGERNYVCRAGTFGIAFIGKNIFHAKTFVLATSDKFYQKPLNSQEIESIKQAHPPRFPSSGIYLPATIEIIPGELVDTLITEKNNG